MGLAEQASPDAWRVRRDFAAVLRAMQKAQDHQRVLHVHGTLLSDDRLPLVVTSLRKVPAVEGRVLAHGEEDCGRQYLLLEGTDVKVHYIYHTPEVTAAWSQGKLRPNSFVRFRRLFGDTGRLFIETTDLGDAYQLLKNNAHFRKVAQGTTPDLAAAVERGWAGWLGKYQAAIARALKAAADREISLCDSTRQR
jgi:hypothetical protein